MTTRMKKLVEVASIFSGNSIPAKKKQELFTNLSAGTPYVATKDISTDHLINYENGILIPDAHSDNFKLAPAGSVLICAEGGSAGKKVAHNNRDIYFVNKLFCISPKEGTLSKYIYYCLLSSNFKAAFESQLTGLIGGVSLSKFKSLQIPYTDITNQKRIVTILDQAFATIEQARGKTEQNLKNARELFESYLQQVFSQRGELWVDRSLAEVSIEFGRGKSKHRPRGDASLLGGNYPLIQTGDISNSDHWITKHTQTYNEKGLNQSKLWPKGTVCIAIVGANVAETAILNFDACFPDSVIGITADPKLASNEYVDYLLQSFKAYLKEKGKGSARDNINLGTFSKQKFPFPPLKTQNIIVSKLNLLAGEASKLECFYRKRLEKLDELKKSILQKTFSDELTKDEGKGVAA